MIPKQTNRQALPITISSADFYAYNIYNLKLFTGDISRPAIKYTDPVDIQ